MQAINRLTQIRDGPGVQKHVVRRRETHCTSGLRGENRACILGGAAVARLDSLYLQCLVGVHHQNPIDARARVAALDEQRYGHYHVRAFCLGRLLLHVGADERVQDGVQRLPRARIVEYQGPQRFAVEAAVSVEHLGAKAFHHPRQARFPRLDHGARRDIGVDDRNAEFRETLL